MTYWLSLEWWKYLLSPKGRWNDVSWWTLIWCRAMGHPAGVVWHNVCALEPDMTCRECGDDLS